MQSILAFFRKKLLLTHIYGVPVKVDYRWFLVLAVMAWFIARSIPVSLVEDEIGKFVLGLVTVVVFFASIFLHELAHAYVARKEGIEVIEILLHPFGGLAKLKRAPNTPRAEFRIAIAGPIASFVIAFIFFGGWLALSSIDTVLGPLFFALFLLNFLLAVFNLFPGYPLDGGRVLRALLWKRGKDLNQATVLTGKFGQIIAATLIVFGVVAILVRGDAFTGLWTILVGLFLFDAATKIIRRVVNFEHLFASDVMEPPVSVAPDTKIMHFVDHTLPLYGKPVVPIAENRQLFGFMSLEDVKEKLPREDWHTTAVEDVMRPVREDYFIEQDSLVTEAVAMMRLNGLGVVGVVDSDGEFVGIIRQGRIRHRN